MASIEARIDRLLKLLPDPMPVNDLKRLTRAEAVEYGGLVSGFIWDGSIDHADPRVARVVELAERARDLPTLEALEGMR